MVELNLIGSKAMVKGSTGCLLQRPGLAAHRACVRWRREEHKVDLRTAFE